MLYLICDWIDPTTRPARTAELANIDGTNRQGRAMQHAEVFSNKPTRLISQDEARYRLGVTLSEFYDLFHSRASSNFPDQIELNGDIWVWVESEIDEYINWLIEERGRKWRDSGKKQMPSESRKGSQ